MIGTWTLAFQAFVSGRRIEMILLGKDIITQDDLDFILVTQ